MSGFVKRKKKNGKSTYIQWDDMNYIKAYDLARDGCTNTEIAKILKYDERDFDRLIARKPALKLALKTAREASRGRGMQKFREYVHGRLPRRLLKIWNKLNEFEEMDNGLDFAQKLLDMEPKHIRQHLLIHAWVMSNYSLTEACRKCGINYDLVRKVWTKDKDFVDLMKQVQVHKKNFFESALIKLVAAGDVNAILFVNRTINKDRGYNDKVQVEVNHTHKHTIDALPLALKMQIRDVLRQQGQTPLLTDQRQVTDAEVVDGVADRA